MLTDFSVIWPRFLKLIDQNRHGAGDGIADVAQFDRQSVFGDPHPASELIQHFPCCLMHQVFVDVAVAQS